MSGVISQWSQDLATMDPTTQVAYCDESNKIIVEERSVWLGREVSTGRVFDKITEIFHRLNIGDKENVLKFLSKMAAREEVSACVNAIFVGQEECNRIGIKTLIIEETYLKTKLTPENLNKGFELACHNKNMGEVRSFLLDYDILGQLTPENLNKGFELACSMRLTDVVEHFIEDADLKNQLNSNGINSGFKETCSCGASELFDLFLFNTDLKTKLTKYSLN